MGGGMSSSGLEDMLTASHMVGRAIAAITFPGMHRIYDFHSTRAPKIKNMSNFIMFGQETDDEADENENAFTESELETVFFVQVGNDKIYLEDPVAVNASGWTPLHTCCMSFLTIPAGLKIIDYMVEHGNQFEIKTIIGPGTFNKGWTPLHMACAYGIEPIVVRLLEAGANPNTTNCYGYSPLLEATHRGFMTIASVLVKHGAKMDYIPPEDLSRTSPFVSTPAQSAIGEAARCGYSRIVQDLLDKGAPKNLPNSLGWTPLHEACFYNRIETVKVLLLSGADSSLRTESGALPYHLAGLQTLRDMIKDMGCHGSLPRNDRDTIDMMTILQELTFSPSERNGCEPIPHFFKSSIAMAKNEKSRRSAHEDSILFDEGRVIKEHHQDVDSDAKHFSGSTHLGPSTTPNSKSKVEEKMQKDLGPQLLHNGPLLGQLPLLNSNGGGTSPAPIKTNTTPSSKKKKQHNETQVDIPKEFLCELCQRQLTDPVKSIYGNIYEKSVIEEWFKNQGKICPLTGAPLSEADLVPQEDLKVKIRKWILQKSTSSDDTPTHSNETSMSSQHKSKSPTKLSNSISGNAVDDDLYDF